MKRNLSIAACQILVAGALLAIMVLVGALSVRTMSNTDEHLQRNYTQYTVPLVDLGALLSEVQHTRALLAAGLGGESSAVSEHFYAQIKPTQENVAKIWNDYRTASVGEPEHNKALQQIDAALAASQHADNEVLALAKSGRYEDAVEKMRGESSRLFDALRRAVIDEMNSRRNSAEVAFSSSAQSNSVAQWGVITLILVGLVAGVSITLVAARRVRRMLAKSVQIAQTIAAGDLSQEIEVVGDDETAQLQRALRDMQGALAALVCSVKANAESVRLGSGEIALGNQDLSGRTEAQAGALQQTAASMEELGSAARHNADHSRQASQLSFAASEVATRGGEAVRQVVLTMAGINDSSRQISDITTVIDGIAFQTNILALNAAVEAARAGEHGRGFAVVASEVRNLAQRSAQAAKEIKALIATSVERVDQGAKLVDQAGQTMTDVVASVRRVVDLVEEISAASEAQKAGVQRVGDSISQLDHATQQNAALVEQSAAAAESLRQQADNLVHTVSVFKVLPVGEGGQSKSHRALLTT